MDLGNDFGLFIAKSFKIAKSCMCLTISGLSFLLPLTLSAILQLIALNLSAAFSTGFMQAILSISACHFATQVGPEQVEPHKTTTSSALRSKTL